MRALLSAQTGAAPGAHRRAALQRRAAPARASATVSSGGESDGRPHVAVIGAGWGGWGAAKALAEAGVRVTVLDAARDPTGATPFTTPSGKPFEAGTRGFWKARSHFRSTPRVHHGAIVLLRAFAARMRGGDAATQRASVVEP